MCIHQTLQKPSGTAVFIWRCFLGNNAQLESSRISHHVCEEGFFFFKDCSLLFSLGYRFGQWISSRKSLSRRGISIFFLTLARGVSGTESGSPVWKDRKFKKHNQCIKDITLGPSPYKAIDWRQPDNSIEDEWIYKSGTLSKERLSSHALKLPQELKQLSWLRIILQVLKVKTPRFP